MQVFLALHRRTDAVAGIEQLVGEALGHGPLAAVTGRADVMDAVHVGGLGGTYGGNPVACAAALATIDMLENGGLIPQAQRLGAAMRTRLDAMKSRDRGIGESIREFFTGSVAARLAHRQRRPVLVVPRDYATEDEKARAAAER